LLVVVGGCWRLLAVVGLSAVVVGCCRLLAVVVGCCRLLAVVGGCWRLLLFHNLDASAGWFLEKNTGIWDSSHDAFGLFWE
jgi:hypothetical protein